MSSHHSSLPLLWIIEYLVSFRQVPISIIHDLIERLPELADDYGKSTREMVALRCLEELFGPRNGLTNEVLPESRVGFDYSETCADVLQSILNETSTSILRKAGPERLKWDIQFFIMHKRASMNKCTLEKLRDVVAVDNHPDAAALRERSGFMQVDESNGNTVHHSHCRTVSWKCDQRGIEPQVMATDGDLVPLKHLKDNNLQDGMRKEFLLPSKRHKKDLAAGSSGVLANGHEDMLDYDACHSNAKKLRLDDSGVDHPVGQILVDLHVDRMMEGFERIVAVPGVEGCILAQVSRAKNDSDEGITLDMLVQSNNYHEVEFQNNEIKSFPSNKNPYEDTYTQFTQVDEAGKAEPITTPCKLMRVEKIGFSDESLKSDDQNIQIQSQDSVSAEIPRQVYSLEASGDMEDPCDEERLGDEDEYQNDYFNLAVNKENFLSSLCKSNQDPLGAVSWTDQNLCVKCNINGDSLVCSTSTCPSVVHQHCLPSAASFDDKGNFYCPFCAYSLSISECLEAKKKVSIARKDLAGFIGIGLGPSSKEVNEEVGKVQSRSSPPGKLNCPAGTNVNEHLGENEHNGTNQTSLLQKIVQDKSQSGSSTSSSKHETVPCAREQENATWLREGKEKVVQKCLSLEEAQLMQDPTVADLICDNGRPSTVNSETVILNQQEVEGGTFEQNLLPDSSESSEKPVCAVNIDGEETSDADNYKFIISCYSVRCRARKRQHTYPVAPQLRQNKIRWTMEEEEILRKGVQRFASVHDRSIPWKKILEFGASVFLNGRTTIDLKDKWRNMCKASPHNK